jgi:sugar lactone lactonase YvrE/thiol-disulfide isomerase/thioredoxin
MNLTLAVGALVGSLLSLAWVSPARGEPRAPELAPNLGWLNTDRPLRLSDELKGHVIVLDFWTLGCINCIHVIPDLAYLEEKFKDEPFIVIGVHSAKFANESDRQAIRNAINRYQVHHPVVIDDAMGIWERYGVRGWPGFVVIDSAGYVRGSTGGEGNRTTLETAVRIAIEEGRKNGTLAKKRFEPKLDAAVPSVSGLAFPGKVIGAEPGKDFAGLLAIADSTHHRVIVTSWPDESGRVSVTRVIGDGEARWVDGAAPSFYEPQGLALSADRKTLYVADRKNHAIRAIELASGKVSTLVGNGQQGRDRAGGKAGEEQMLNSPWDLALSADGKTLYVAMAGPHQLWQVDIASGVAKVLAGSGREALIDGAANMAALAQPSGLSLSADGTQLAFADSEVSAVRILDLSKQRVRTVVGTGLFDFGDVDGVYPQARLQHALGVAWWKDGASEKLIVADTYNHKLKLVDPVANTSSAWLGIGRAMDASGKELKLDEPGGVFLAGSTLLVPDTNNHRIVTVDVKTKRWREVMIEGLAMPGKAAAVPEGAVKAKLELASSKAATLEISGEIPAGAHANAEVPITVRVSDAASGALIAQKTVRSESFPVSVVIDGGNVKAGAKWIVELSYAYCTDGTNATCVPGNAAWVVEVAEGKMSAGALK